MVLNEDTIELINYSKNIDIDYNIKLFLILFFIALSIFLVWYSKKIERDTDLSNMIYYLTTYISILVIGFIPLYIFLLLRSVDIDLLLKYTFVLYGVIFIGVLLFGLWWATQRFLMLFGVDFKSKRGKSYRKYRDYRRAE